MTAHIEPDLLETLLNRAESDSLDFKRDQYPLGDVGQKAELIKDILAFANSWGTEDAHILVGIEEKQEGRHRVVGVSTHLAESELQQLVNSKTNRPVAFQYFSQPVDGTVIGVIRIPAAQERPFYLESRFGPLHEDRVYLRRGSSTAVASPDEVARMGTAAVKASITPRAELSIITLEGDELTTGITSTVLIERPPPDPELERLERELQRKVLGGIAFFEPPTIASALASIERGPSTTEIREYHRQLSLLREVSFRIRNTGPIALEDLRLESRIQKTHTVQLKEELPERPRGRSLIPFIPTPRITGRDWTAVEDTGSEWLVTCKVAKVRPAETHTTHPIYVGSTEETTVHLPVTVFGHNLPTPLQHQFDIEVHVNKRYFSDEHDELPAEEDY